MWVAQTEGAKFRLGVVTELKNRGVEDVFITCVDGLKGLPEAIETVFPKTEVQRCIVHLVRQSLNYVGWTQRKEVAADMKLIYSARAVRSFIFSRLKTLRADLNISPSSSSTWCSICS